MGRQLGNYPGTGSGKSTDEASSGYIKGTITGDIRCLLVSMSVRRHRFISIDDITMLRCHCSGFDLRFSKTGEWLCRDRA